MHQSCSYQTEKVSANPSTASAPISSRFYLFSFLVAFPSSIPPPSSFQALALMENKEAVACLLDLVCATDIKEEYHLVLGVLLKMSSIPAFAKEVSAHVLRGPFLG